MKLSTVDVSCAFLFLLVLLLNHHSLILSQSISQEQEGNCERAESCGDCIQQLNCAWCTNPEYDGTRKARCSSKFWENNECSEEFIVNPSTQFDFKRNEETKKGINPEDTIQLKPQHVYLKLRAQETFNITIEFVQAKDYPVDLYYLMDLSNSMKDDKETVAKLGKSLTESMSSVTGDFRIGFGPFVDKVIMPFVSTVPKRLETPCDNEVCVRPFSFKHMMKLSQDPDLFVKTVNESIVSGNLDGPEGGFDAIMQAIVCEKEIGWRQNARKILMFSTDASFHFAGDGKLAGIMEPNDGKCHLNKDGAYTHAEILDYPSIAQINSKAIEKSISIIFAVTEEFTPSYLKLTKGQIQGSTVAVLSTDSSNVVEIIKKEYEKLSTEVKLRDTLTENNNIEIKYFSNCKEEANFIPGKTCSGIKGGDKVSFIAQVSLKRCPQNDTEWNQIFDIQVSGLDEKVKVELELLCRCDCDKPGSSGYIENSQVCNFKGNSTCGICSCQDKYYGDTCKCKIGEDIAEDEAIDFDPNKSCRHDNLTNLICSNRGDCICGTCHCHQRADKNEKYEGKYCECDNFSCRRVQGVLCSGFGSCKCGKCECDSNWSGDACECSAETSGCMEPGGTELCNGQGTCKCNRCECNKNETTGAVYSGLYCERCPNCPDKCDQMLDCIQCSVHGTGTYGPDKIGCAAECSKYSGSIELVDYVSEHVGRDSTYCTRIDVEDDCYIYFTYEYDNSVPHSPSNLKIKAQKTKDDCPLQAQLHFIIPGIIVGTLLLGLLILLIYRCCTYWKDKREYERFFTEGQKAKWDKAENPLYKDPRTQFQNPTYGRSERAHLDY